MWSDHIFHYRPKSITFRHNGLLKSVKITWCLLKIKKIDKNCLGSFLMAVN